MLLQFRTERENVFTKLKEVQSISFLALITMTWMTNYMDSRDKSSGAAFTFYQEEVLLLETRAIKLLAHVFVLTLMV